MIPTSLRDALFPGSNYQQRRAAVLEHIQQIGGIRCGWLDHRYRSLEQLEAIDRLMSAGVIYNTGFELKFMPFTSAHDIMRHAGDLVAAGFASRKRGEPWEFYRPEKDENHEHERTGGGSEAGEIDCQPAETNPDGSREQLAEE